MSTEFCKETPESPPYTREHKWQRIIHLFIILSSCVIHNRNEGKTYLFLPLTRESWIGIEKKSKFKEEGGSITNGSKNGTVKVFTIQAQCALTSEQSLKPSRRWWRTKLWPREEQFRAFALPQLCSLLLSYFCKTAAFLMPNSLEMHLTCRNNHFLATSGKPSNLNTIFIVLWLLPLPGTRSSALFT